MTADKPEAGRMCKPWCDTFASAYPVKSYCSDECKAACRPLNPAPYPVEYNDCTGCNCCEIDECDAPHEKCSPSICNGDGSTLAERQKPRPVGRCSCSESVALRKALEDIVKCAHVNAPRETIDRIARRALALGEEE